jgi:uncharacterized protein YuzE
MNRQSHPALLQQLRAPRITHDPAANVAYVHLLERPSGLGSDHCAYAFDQRVVFDMDAEERVLGIEFLDARMLRPETLAQANEARSVEELLEPLDCVVLAATRADRRAIERLCVEYHQLLVRDAARALGRAHQHDAEDVVQSLWIGLSAGICTFPLIRGAGLPWLRRQVRSMAAALLSSEGGR